MPLTVEGYTVLHQMMRVRWPLWRQLDDGKKAEIVREASEWLDKAEQNPSGQSGSFSLLGHKGDLMLVHFRQSFEELNQAELQLAQLRLNDYLEPTTSYLSVIELGLYESTVKIYTELAERGIETHSEEWKRRGRRNSRQTTRSDETEIVSGVSQTSLHLLLSHGPAARGAAELVFPSH